MAKIIQCQGGEVTHEIFFPGAGITALREGSGDVNAFTTQQPFMQEDHTSMQCAAPQKLVRLVVEVAKLQAELDHKRHKLGQEMTIFLAMSEAGILSKIPASPAGAPAAKK